MVSPLDIHIVELHQLFHYNIGTWSTVKNIADNVKIVNSQVLNQIAESCDKLRTHSVINDGMNNLVIIYLFVFIIVVHMKKFVNNVCECRRHFFTHLGSCIFGRNLLANPHQTVNINALPVIIVTFLPLCQPQDPFRIINQIRQCDFLFIGNHITKGF